MLEHRGEAGQRLNSRSWGSVGLAAAARVETKGRGAISNALCDREVRETANADRGAKVFVTRRTQAPGGRRGRAFEVFGGPICRRDRVGGRETSLAHRPSGELREAIPAAGSWSGEADLPATPGIRTRRRWSGRRPRVRSGRCRETGGARSGVARRHSSATLTTIDLEHRRACTRP